MMPGMDGFQLAEAIKADPSIAAVALVLLPSFGNRGHGERARRVGIVGYLQKPVRQSQLYNCLTAVMQRPDTAPATESQLVTQHSIREAEAKQKDKTFSGVRIIIAEDNLVNQKVALGQLYSLGYAAEAVSNGRELLRALDNAEFDLILMDCQMPEMDGFAATAEIRRREGADRHTTIIAMTANALEGDDEKCFAAGMDDYLSKPVKPEALRLKLQRWTESGESDRILSEGNGSARQSRDSVIDLSQLDGLRQIQQPGAGDFISELIDLFVNEAVSQLKLLREAVAANDAPGIMRVAHCLKGSSGNMGASQMAAISEKLENKDPTKDTKALLVELEKEFELVRAALEAERK
jgi:CheY-like chemotaxis protein/HPt (histidine-containing phosphotransfer) domain-containing protein